MSDLQSRAAQLYQEIVGHSDPAAFLCQLVDQHKAENDFLEFKGAGTIGDKDIRKHWSQALSGFANTEGGVLIWGIRAARMPMPSDPSRKVDAATGLDLAQHPESFLQTLKDLRLEATIDAVQGVEYEHYGAGKGDRSGFVVCLIPEGIHKPYLASLHPVKQYYQRIGDSFAVIPHAMLRSLFYPRTSPRLCLDVICLKSAVTKKGRTAEFLAQLFNRGTSSAWEICLYRDWLLSKDYTLSWSPVWKPVRDENKNVIGGSSTEPLHPGQCMEVGSVKMVRDSQAMESDPSRGDLQLYLNAFLRDQPPQTIDVEFSEEEIVRKARKEFEASPRPYWD